MFLNACFLPLINSFKASTFPVFAISIEKIRFDDAPKTQQLSLNREDMVRARLNTIEGYYSSG
jgi:hypothetical protein